jgi:hypothetical protein
VVDRVGDVCVAWSEQVWPGAPELTGSGRVGYWHGMSLSTIVVALNAQLLRSVDLRPAQA